MRLSTISAIIAITLPLAQCELKKPLDIQVTTKKECTQKTRDGSRIEVHYKGTLVDGSSFPSLRLWQRRNLF